jgi:hypothetical protein
LAVLGKQDLVFGILRNDELAWEFSDSYKHLGCASRKSICETPIGVFYLGYDGKVKLLDGNRPVMDFKSDEVGDYVEQFRGSWEYAVGSYSARHQQYLLQFPRGGRPSYIKLLVYDFRQGWMTASLWTGPDAGAAGIMCSTTDLDGDSLWGGVASDEHGVFKYASSDSNRLGGLSRITLLTHFDEINAVKTLQRLKPIFTADEDLALQITVTPEDTATRLGDTLHGELELTGFTSGKIHQGRIALTDRAFTFTAEYFEALNAVLLEIESQEGVNQSE